jgi:hypothetical protein
MFPKMEFDQDGPIPPEAPQLNFMAQKLEKVAGEKFLYQHGVEGLLHPHPDRNRGHGAKFEHDEKNNGGQATGPVVEQANQRQIGSRRAKKSSETLADRPGTCRLLQGGFCFDPTRRIDA